MRDTEKLVGSVEYSPPKAGVGALQGLNWWLEERRIKMDIQRSIVIGSGKILGINI